jgi:hippurate hydrolase
MTPERLRRYREVRRTIHRHPELGFEERRTSELVASHLESLGLEPVRGIGRTGVVATIRKGIGARSIGLRADMDALPVQELGDIEHRSTIQSCFHGCGHDGHTVMLLAAADLLRSARFDGTVHLIFQPAEEGLGGAAEMIADGLFERFPCDEIYGLHNMPGIPAGQFATCPGPFFAGADRFEIEVRGRGGHAAMPHRSIDPIVVCAHIIVALQTIVSRNSDPLSAAVVTVGAVQAGNAFNVIPESARLRGTVRYLDPAQASDLRRRLATIVEHVAKGFDADATLDYAPVFPVLVNHAAPTANAIGAATSVAGEAAVRAHAVPIMGSEDFATMLERVPGCYVLIGNGEGSPACMLHDPRYDFNDDIIPTGAAYWVRLAESVLKAPVRHGQ